MPASKLCIIAKHLLGYIIAAHRDKIRYRRDAIALFIHARMLAMGATFCDLEGNASTNSFLPEDWASPDLVRLNYTIPSFTKDASKSKEHVIFFVVVENDNSVSINTTNSVTEEFGHTDMNAPEFVRLDYLNETIDVERIFPNLDRLDTLVSTELFKKVLPKLPPPAPTPQAAQERTRSQLEPAPRQQVGYAPPPPRYGAADLDPLGGIGGPGGGMVIDPHQALRRPYAGGGLEGDLFAPPGARFDPIGPPMMPGARGRGGPRGGRFNNPDPDNAVPSRWDDMFM